MYIAQGDLNDGAEFGKALHKCLPPSHEHFFRSTGKVAFRVLFFRCPCGNAQHFPQIFLCRKFAHQNTQTALVQP